MRNKVITLMFSIIFMFVLMPVVNAETRQNTFTNDDCITDTGWQSSAKTKYRFDNSVGMYELQGDSYSSSKNQAVYYTVSNDGTILYAYVPNYNSAIGNSNTKETIYQAGIISNYSCENTLKVSKNVVGSTAPLITKKDETPLFKKVGAANTASVASIMIIALGIALLGGAIYFYLQRTGKLPKKKDPTDDQFKFEGFGMFILTLGMFLIPFAVSAVDINSPDFKSVDGSKYEANSITAAWDSKNSGSSYYIETFISAKNQYNRFANSVNEYTYRNLESGKTYNLKMRVCSSKGVCSGWSKIYSVTPKNSVVKTTDQAAAWDSNYKTTLKVGEKQQLEIPEQCKSGGCTYETSNSDIVTVDENGNVIGVKDGYAVITVRDAEGNIIKTIPIKIGDGNPEYYSDRLYPIGKDLKLDPPSGHEACSVLWESLTPEIVSVDKCGNANIVGSGPGVIVARDPNTGEILKTYDIGGYNPNTQTYIAPWCTNKEDCNCPEGMHFNDTKDACLFDDLPDPTDIGDSDNPNDPDDPDEPQCPSTLSFKDNQKNITIPVGEERQLEIVTGPKDQDDYGSFEYTSSNSDIVDVGSSDGVITGVEKGYADITVKVEDCSSPTDILHVTVTDDNTNAKSIELTGDEKAEIGKGSVMVTAQLDPSTATDALNWEFEAIDEEENGEVEIALSRTITTDGKASNYIKPTKRGKVRIIAKSEKNEEVQGTFEMEITQALPIECTWDDNDAAFELVYPWTGTEPLNCVLKDSFEEDAKTVTSGVSWSINKEPVKKADGSEYIPELATITSSSDGVGTVTLKSGGSGYVVAKHGNDEGSYYFAVNELMTGGVIKEKDTGKGSGEYGPVSKGAKFNLVFTPSPVTASGDISWVSDNEGLAIVSDDENYGFTNSGVDNSKTAVVEVKSAPEEKTLVTITALRSDDNKELASFKFYVVPSAVPAGTCDNDDEADYCMGTDDSFEIDSSDGWFEENEANDYKWTSSDISIVNVTDATGNDDTIKITSYGKEGLVTIKGYDESNNGADEPLTSDDEVDNDPEQDSNEADVTFTVRVNKLGDDEQNKDEFDISKLTWNSNYKVNSGSTKEYQISVGSQKTFKLTKAANGADYAAWWSSKYTGVASVSPTTKVASVTVTGKSRGCTIISAAGGNFKNSATNRVQFIVKVGTSTCSDTTAANIIGSTNGQYVRPVVVKGDSLQLTAYSFQTFKELSTSAWGVKDENIMSITSGGQITGKAVGSTSVTTDYGGKTVSMSASVVKKPTSITIKKLKNNQLHADGCAKLYRTVKPTNKTNVSWSSSSDISIKTTNKMAEGRSGKKYYVRVCGNNKAVKNASITGTSKVKQSYKFNVVNKSLTFTSCAKKLKKKGATVYCYVDIYPYSYKLYTKKKQFKKLVKTTTGAKVTAVKKIKSKPNRYRITVKATKNTTKSVKLTVKTKNKVKNKRLSGTYTFKPYK